MSNQPKCQCDLEGKLDPDWASLYNSETELPFVNHEPNECKCQNDLRLYKRGEEVLWLCSCCHTSKDKEISE